MMITAVLLVGLFGNSSAQDDGAFGSYYCETPEECLVLLGEGSECIENECVQHFAAGSGSNNTLYYVILAIAVLAAGGYWYLKKQPATKSKKAKAKKK